MAGGSTSHTATACATTFALDLDSKNTYYSNTTRGRTSRAAAAGGAASSARPRPAVPPPRTTLAGRITFCVTTTRASTPCTCQRWQDDLPAQLRPSGTTTTRGSTTTAGAAPPPPTPTTPLSPPRRLVYADIPARPIPGGHPRGVIRDSRPGGRLGSPRPRWRTTRTDATRACPGSGGSRPSPPARLRSTIQGGGKSPARYRAGAPLAFLPLLGDDEGRRASLLAWDGRLGPALGSGERRD